MTPPRFDLLPLHSDPEDAGKCATDPYRDTKPKQMSAVTTSVDSWFTEPLIQTHRQRNQTLKTTSPASWAVQ